jgi:serine/threonine protein kinase
MAAMTASKGELIAANAKTENSAVNGEENVKLEDFKIKKLIDKGSFGKVYLVVNIKDGKEYAMKRINKDILIEKGQIINTRTEKDILF